MVNNPHYNLALNIGRENHKWDSQELMNWQIKLDKIKLKENINPPPYQKTNSNLYYFILYFKLWKKRLQTNAILYMELVSLLVKR